jgi:hypothetical protein
MYTLDHVSTKHRLADVPIEMPVAYVLALPPYVTSRWPSQPLFNLVDAINQWLGHFSFERAWQIIRPCFWAPAWDDGQLASFAVSPIPLTQFRTRQFPGTNVVRDASSMAHRRFEIVHFNGRVDRLADGRICLLLDENEALAENQLEDALQSAQTRLIIIETESGPDFGLAVALGRFLVEGGGPAVLVATSQNADTSVAFFSDMVGHLLHNRLLLELL